MGTRLFVGGLTSRVRERDLEKFFGKYGRIKEIAMKNGFAFVDFDDYRDADDAMYELNGKDLLGERVSVERARGTPRGGDQWRGGGRGGYGSSRGRSSRESDMRSSSSRYEGPPTRTEHRLIVENLSSRVSWQDLKDYMRQAGKVTYADAHKQRKNEGIVEFASYADLEKAIEELDDSELNGRRIRLVEDRRRSRGGGGGGGRRSSRLSDSRSRSRSRSPRRGRRSRSGSRKSRSKSRDASSKSKSRSRSGSFPKEKNGTGAKRSRSRSMSKDRGGGDSKSRSRSPAGDSPDKRD